MPEKKKISAVICELNPLHQGHRLLFQHARALSEGVICVLSGNYVQRGEPAIWDKWYRCRSALENGADLVLELPLPWACSGAERFAMGGVFLANALGNVEFLVFGCENPELSKLEALADSLLSPEFSAQLSKLPSGDGETFARRREKALSKLLGEETAAFLRKPNCILAVEYLKALKRLSSPIRPIVFPRVGAGHDSPSQSGELPSAGELREKLRDGKSIGGMAPSSIVSLWETVSKDGGCPADINRLELPILCKLRTMSPEDFAALPDVSEGLENRLYRASRQAGSLRELYALTKTKRYPLSRIRRLVLSAFLGIPADLPPYPPYLRVLGMNETGRKILEEASPSLPLAVRPRDFQKLGDEAQRLFLLEARADDLYALSLPRPQPCGRDFTEKLVKL